MSRVRDMLKGYYGTTEKDDKSQDSSIDGMPRHRAANALWTPHSAAQSLLTLGYSLPAGAGFKPEPYVKKIFATNNLKTLVAETQTIRNDIKQLDESMQMLVCESYNKVGRQPPDSRLLC